MRNLFQLLLLLSVLFVQLTGCSTGRQAVSQLVKTDSLSKMPAKPVIYQLLVRLFGNQDTTNRYYGSITENGVGKFNDITDLALDSIKALGITYIWYTGVLEHATMTDYSTEGIRQDDPDVVKGRAGSPYAVKDYYDVDPDLAVHIPDRMAEYENLIKRTHCHGLKLLMDFIPNHVARTYHSDSKPDSVTDFGAKDDTSLAFSPGNDFYYLPHTTFKVPAGVDGGGPEYKSALKDHHFKESPAKATGNNVFRPDPSIDDWYETIKLNYGVDMEHGGVKHFKPLPPVWLKMRDILLFWAAKGVNGFRCDVAEMVPVEFWHWVIGTVKQKYPDLIFIAEAYSPEKYVDYIQYGGFDYLYNKVGLYDALKPLIKNDPDADVNRIVEVMRSQEAIGSHMLNFLENHDEERLASSKFAGSPVYSIAAMGLAATISTGPVLIYFGQELGEKAENAEGFGADDGKTTIFDYWGVPAVQHWANHGKYDGAGLTDAQLELRTFYKNLLSIAGGHTAITTGKYQAVTGDGWNNRQFGFFRFDQKQCLLILSNFDRRHSLKGSISLPRQLVTRHYQHGKELFSQQEKTLDQNNQLKVDVPPAGFQIWELH